MKKTFLKLSLVLLVPFFAACNEEEHAHSDENVVSEVTEGSEAIAEHVEAVSEKVETAVEEVNDENVFKEGSWGYSLLSYLDSEESKGEEIFQLDEITLSEGDDENLSEAADKQIFELASLLKSHPNTKAEIQGHSKEASNALGKKTKKAWSKAKAFFVRKKLIAQGVSEDQLRHEGYGDEFLLEGVDGKDGSQNRISVKFSK